MFLCLLFSDSFISFCYSIFWNMIKKFYVVVKIVDKLKLILNNLMVAPLLNVIRSNGTQDL